MLSFDEALSRLLGGASRLGAERVPLDEAAGRVLAEDVIARAAMPAFDYSSMDGYACPSRRLHPGAGRRHLPASIESAAGGAPAGALEPGSTCRIFTGARLPEGADAIIMQEDIELSRGDGRKGSDIIARAAPKVGDWVRLRRHRSRGGSNGPLARGEAHGGEGRAPGGPRSTPRARRSPTCRVTVLCTGTPLRLPGEPGPLGSIPESNGYFVAAQGRAAGALVRIASLRPG